MFIDPQIPQLVGPNIEIPMSVRKKYDERCTRCLMKQDLCICAEIPKISLATKIIVLTSKREILVPTNTGRLACEALENSAILVRGDQA